MILQTAAIDKPTIQFNARIVPTPEATDFPPWQVELRNEELKCTTKQKPGKEFKEIHTADKQVKNVQLQVFGMTPEFCNGKTGKKIFFHTN